MSVLEALNWRAAIKQFDPEKKVDEADIAKLIDSANLAPTSGGLQPFRVIVVRNQEIKERLVAASYNQKQVADASHLLVFAAQENFTTDDVNSVIGHIEKERGLPASALDGYRQSMSQYISSMEETAKFQWASRQAFISLGTIMTAAGDLKIDSCPMEGFNPIAYQQELGLKDKGLMPVALLPVGYRMADDQYSQMKKVRRELTDFVIEVN